MRAVQGAAHHSDVHMTARDLTLELCYRSPLVGFPRGVADLIREFLIQRFGGGVQLLASRSGWQTLQIECQETRAVDDLPRSLCDARRPKLRVPHAHGGHGRQKIQSLASRSYRYLSVGEASTQSLGSSRMKSDCTGWMTGTWS